MNAPCLGPLTQRRQQVGITAFRQHDVWIMAVEGLHHALQSVWTRKWEHVAWSNGLQTDGLDRRQTHRQQASIVQRTVPFGLHAKDAHVVHDVRKGTWREGILDDLHATKKLDTV